MKNINKKSMTFELNVEDFERLKKLSLREDMSYGQILRKSIKNYLDRTLGVAKIDKKENE